MAQGTIKKVILEKGFGFIKTSRGEIFFHSSALQDVAFESLREGTVVDFTETRGPKGPRAEAIKVVAP